ISAAIDRDAIVKLVYQGRGAGIVSQVTPGNKRWIDPKVSVPKRDLAHAKDLLRQAGFTWTGTQLRDPSGTPVAFSIIAPSNNSARVQMATLMQNDLKDIGIDAAVVPLEFRSLLDRVTNTHDYDAAIMGFGSGDVDPTAEMNVWMSSGSTHLWHQGEKPAGGWQAEIDRLMQAQMVTLDYRKRKQQYDQVQELVAENLPIVPLASPDILVGAKKAIGNFKPAILDHYTLSNVEELFWRGTQ
ncbi:MAG TPA: ABC transporter substrate-binding protein, partial [Terriglobales bacterium]